MVLTFLMMAHDSERTLELQTNKIPKQADFFLRLTCPIEIILKSNLCVSIRSVVIHLLLPFAGTKIQLKI